ncbi:unnamed protein product, partial [Meganyctiphanes norvegica]
MSESFQTLSRMHVVLSYLSRLACDTRTVKRSRAQAAGSRRYRFVIKCFRIVLEFIGKIVCWVKYRNDPHITLPPIKDPILLEPAHSLAAKIRTQTLTSVQVVKAFIARIQEINPILNCMVDERFTEALKEAEAADQLIKMSSIETLAQTKPFLGVPFSTKDILAVKGLKHVSGLWVRRNIVAEEDAGGVALMRKAGAIPMCVTNCPELGMWWESYNTVYGRTNNPYKTCRISGGSSGGEAVLQSSCGAPFGIGSDIGGSIRMPSFFNGIFGHKPTFGIVSNSGSEPQATGEANDFLVTGPMCRNAADLTPMFKILAGDNVQMLKLDQKVDISKLRYFYIEDDGGNVLVTPMHPELRAAQLKIVDYLNKAYGIKAKKIKMKKLRGALDIYLAKLGSIKEAPKFCEELALRNGKVNIWLEFVKWLFCLSYNTWPSIALGIMEELTKDSETVKARNEKLVHKCAELRNDFKELLGDDGVLLFPSHPTPAPYHTQPLFRPFNFIYTAIINVLKLPSTQCPLGLGTDGVPLGIQIIANHYQDHLSLAVAQELEKAFGGWVSPSRVR